MLFYRIVSLFRCSIFAAGFIHVMVPKIAPAQINGNSTASQGSDISKTLISYSGATPFLPPISDNKINTDNVQLGTSDVIRLLIVNPGKSAETLLAYWSALRHLNQIGRDTYEKKTPSIQIRIIFDGPLNSLIRRPDILLILWPDPRAPYCESMESVQTSLNKNNWRHTYDFVENSELHYESRNSEITINTEKFPSDNCMRRFSFVTSQTPSQGINR